MRLVIPIRIDTRFGSVSEELTGVVSSKTKAFLEKLSDVLTDNPTLVGADFTKIIPIQNPRDINVEEVVKKLTSQINSENIYTELVIDVGGLNNNNLPQPNMIIAISTVVDVFLKVDKIQNILITFPKNINENDDFYFAMKNIARHKEVTIFYYDTGKILTGSAGNNYSSDTRNSLLNLSAMARKSNKDNLKDKLVCHMGRYVVDGSDRIIYDYYEGNYASSEIFEEIRSIIINQLKLRTEPLHILYDDRGSDWFSRSVNSAINSFDEKIVSEKFSTFNSEKFSNNFNLIILPVFRSGKTANGIMEIVKPHFVHGETEVWALIDVKSASDSEKDRFIHMEGVEPTRVKSIIELGARGQFLESIWSNVELEPLHVREIDLKGNFSAECMWGMIYEAGIIPEKDVPLGIRHALGTVLNSEEMVRLNGPLFASKISRILSKHFGSLAGSNFTFLHPDEDAANLLASAVKDLSRNDSLRVRSEIFKLARTSQNVTELVNNAHSSKAELGEYCENLIEQYKTLNENENLSRPSQMKIVLLSEFNATGSTINGMRKFAEMMDWTIVTSLSLANMIPEVLEQNKAECSFYEFGYQLQMQGDI